MNARRSSSTRTILPWRWSAVRYLPFTTSAGQLLDLAEDALVQGVRESRPIHLLAISAASNVTGEILPVAKPARLCSCQVFDQHF